jgi:DNA-directed RNA polymerase beta' subunit
MKIVASEAMESQASSPRLWLRFGVRWANNGYLAPPFGCDYAPPDKMLSSSLLEEGVPMVVGKSLVTMDALYAGARKGGIVYVRTGPANHHGGYFDVVYMPSGATAGPDYHALMDEINGIHPLCSVCHKSRVAACPGHRIGIKLPFYYVQPHFLDKFLKFLNAICLNIVFDTTGQFRIEGCGLPRTDVPKKKSLSDRLKGTACVCHNCRSSRQGNYMNAHFIPGEYGGIAFKSGNREVPIALGSLMSYISIEPVRTNVLDAAQMFGMRLDIRHIVTDTLYLPPYQLRPSGPQGEGFETQTYRAIANACAKLGYPPKTDSINTTPNGERLYGEIFDEISKIMTVKKGKKQNADNKTLYQSISTKTGYIRANVTSAHATNVGRAVVTPSTGNFGEVTVSRFFHKLCTSVVVNRYNIDQIRILASEGMVTWVRDYKTGEEVKYKPGVAIKLGDTVWRYLLTGDVAVANRQPTLHRLSLMSHFLRFINSPVLGLHRCETPAYNADHDGDEMNLHPASDEPSMLELRSIAHVVNNLMGPGGPAMGPLFHELGITMIISIRVDEPVGNPDDYLAALTVSVDKERRIASYPARRARLVAEGRIPAPPGTGLIETYRDVCSLLFPEDFCYDSRGLTIFQGVLVKGEFEKKNIGMSGGSVMHMLSLFPKKRQALFANDVCKICDVYMENHSVTLDPKYMVQDDAYYAKIADLTASSREHLEEAFQMKEAARSEIERNQIENRIMMLAAAPLGYIMRTIGKSGKEAERIKQLAASGAPEDVVAAARRAHNTDRTRNVFEIMYKSGCRGSERTAMQISMTLGAQYTGSKRTSGAEIPWIRNPRAAPGPDGRRRQTLLANGVIWSSFMVGLTPEEYALHMDPVRNQVAYAKLGVSAAGHLGKVTADILGPRCTAPDLAILSGAKTIAWGFGGFIDPMDLLPGHADGRNIASFVHVGTLIGAVNYELGA